MALSPLGYLLLCVPVGAAVLIASGTVASKPARRLTIGVAIIPLVPLCLAFLVGFGTGISEGLLQIAGFVTIAFLCLRLHWLIAAMKWKHAWLAHVPVALLNCGMAGVVFIWFVLAASFGSGGHH